MPPAGGVRMVLTHLVSVNCCLVLVAEMEFAKFLIAKEQSVSINAFLMLNLVVAGLWVTAVACRNATSAKLVQQRDTGKKTTQKMFNTESTLKSHL